METEIARAEALYQARRWRDVRAVYQELLPKLSGASRERAMLRLAQADLPSQAGTRCSGGPAAHRSRRGSGAHVPHFAGAAHGQERRPDVCVHHEAGDRASAKLLDRGSAFCRRQLFLGDARSQPRRRILPALGSRISPRAGTPRLPMARGLDGISEPASRYGTADDGLSAAISDGATCGGCAVLARAPERKRRQSRTRPRVLSRRRPAFSANVFCGARGGAAADYRRNSCGNCGRNIAHTARSASAFVDESDSGSGESSLGACAGAGKHRLRKLG